ncbi:penicillin-binding protein 1C [Azospirillum rugosum]|uniref:peptidoglycan glycosyltransferase n=1 Tax=Azospirillum rugosum TaxID=416170 RepID=A0ABS4SUB8_9PROT|nr:penicillin-binding protein 1C [Azospirillum rugosum]MBP2296163.1 penicillin-binding protein 1C [Azospirillum rugosum]MDQ0527152.1 penicillin-binding protein 1C [Azospirillum rugosum]
MVAILATGTLAAALLALDALFPPPLQRLQDLSVTVTDRAGEPLRVFTNKAGAWRLPATADQVAPAFVDLLLAYEDRRFANHPGVDPLAVLRAAGQNLTAGRVVSGASTLTMQVARLLEPRPRTLRSKLIEMARAAQLEWRYDKRAILGMYLTLAPYGGNVEGIRAASLTLFGKPPTELPPAEAALLVALPQAPSLLRPDRAAERARAARDKVLDRAVLAGALSPRAAAEAKQDPVPAAKLPLPASAPHLADALRGAHPGQAVVASTLDGVLQRAVEAMTRREAETLHERAGLAVLVVDNRTRSVLTWVGSPDFLDERRQGPIDMVRAVRSPGSALKPFIYGLGFDEGLIHPLTQVADVSTRFGAYAPRNFDRGFSGDLTIAEALQRSLNVPAVLVLDRVGPMRFTEALRRAGATLVMPPGTAEPGLPVALGGASISLLDMAALYAGLARDGMVAPLRADPTAPEGASNRLLSPAAAQQVRAILEGAPPPTGVVQDQGQQALGPIALKTGTSYGFRDAWAFGVTERFTVGVWVGRPDGTPSPDRYGRNTAAPLLYRVYDLLPRDRGRPAGPLPAGTAPPALLRRLNAGEPALAAGPRQPDPPRLVFPSNDMVLEALGPDGQADALTLTATGGRRPLSWLVDGRRVAVTPIRRDIDWTPGGAGTVRITVLDADGRSDSATVEIR